MSSTAQLPKPRRSVRELLEAPRTIELMRALLPRHMTPDRMIRLAVIAVQKTPKLGQCDPATLLGAFLGCSALGLEPNTPQQHIHLIPFENRAKGITEVQIVVGYRGLVELGRRSGLIRGMHADVVYPNDEFEYQFGTETFLRHRPQDFDGDVSAFTHAYCHVQLTDGQAFVVMPRSAVLRVRDKSQGYVMAKRFNKLADSPWTAHLDRMARKTAIRQLFSGGEVPLSLEMVGALALDERKVDFAALAEASADEIKENLSGFASDDEMASEERPEAPRLAHSSEQAINAIDTTTGEIREPAEAPAQQPAANAPPQRQAGKVALFSDE